MLFVSVQAQNWEAFTSKFYYFNDVFEQKNVLPSAPSSLIFAGDSWIVNASQPFMMKGDAKTPVPGFVKGLSDAGFNTKLSLKIIYAPTGMVYVHSNSFFAYKNINDAKWQGFSIEKKTKVRPTGPIPNFEFSVITTSTLDKNGNLIIAGIKNDLPVIAKLKDNQWEYLNMESLIKTAPVLADKHSKFSLTFGGLGFGVGPDGFTFIDEDYIKEHTSLPAVFYIYSLVCDKNNDLWFLSDKNLWKISDNGMTKKSTEKINFINVSAKGDIYAATEAEVKKVTNDKFEPIGLPWKIQTFYIDANDNLWFVPFVTTNDKTEPLDVTDGFKAGFKAHLEEHKKKAKTAMDNHYLRLYNPKTKRLITFTTKISPFAEAPVKFITSDESGKLYFVASTGIYLLTEPVLNDGMWSADYDYTQTKEQYNDKNWCASFQRNENECIVLVKNKIGFIKNGTVEYKDLTLIPAVKNMSNIFYNYFTSVVEDKKGNIYIGTPVKGVFKYGEKGCTSLNLDEKIAGDEITALVVDKNDNLWVGTDKALAKYDGKSFTYYNKKNSGMENSEINALYVSDDNVLWIATDGGLYNFDGNNWTMFNKKNSGLAGNKIEALTGFGNKIYFTASDELYSIEDGKIVYEAQSDKRLKHVHRNGLFVAPSGNLWVVARGITIGYKDSNGIWTMYDKTNSPVSDGGSAEMTYTNGILNIYLKRSTWSEPEGPTKDITGKTINTAGELRDTRSERLYTLDNEFILHVKTK
jgi:hypothetical protein